MNHEVNTVLAWSLWDSGFDVRVERHIQKGWMRWNNVTQKMEEWDGYES